MLRTTGTPPPSVKKITKPSSRVIKAIVHHIAATFNPEKIILFGSYAYGNPKAGSDLDLLVVMDTPQGEIETALAIRKSLPPYPFSIDVIARSRKTLERRKEMGDWFLQEISIKGKTMYERTHA